MGIVLTIDPVAFNSALNTDGIKIVFKIVLVQEHGMVEQVLPSRYFSRYYLWCFAIIAAQSICY